MTDRRQAVTLMKEGHRVWEEGRLDDALALLEAAAASDPTLPDPWIDISALRRQLGRPGAIDADRRLVELAAGIDDLLAEFVQAQARVAHRDGWDRHLASHVARDEQLAMAAAALRTEAESGARQKLVAFRADLETRIAAARDELARIPKRKLRDSFSKESDRARDLKITIDDLLGSLRRLGEPSRLMDTPTIYASPPRPSAAAMLEHFDAMRLAGQYCDCGVSLAAVPPPPLIGTDASPPPAPPPPPPRGG